MDFDTNDDRYLDRKEWVSFVAAMSPVNAVLPLPLISPFIWTRTLDFPAGVVTEVYGTAVQRVSVQTSSATGLKVLALPNAEVAGALTSSNPTLRPLNPEDPRLEQVVMTALTTSPAQVRGDKAVAAALNATAPSFEALDVDRDGRLSEAELLSVKQMPETDRPR